MELFGIFLNHFLSSLAILWENIPTLISSWSTSFKFVQFENHSKCSLAQYPLSPLNCMCFLAYPWGSSWRADGRSIGKNLLAFPGVIVGFSRGIEDGVTNKINLLWVTTEPWKTIKLNDGGFLSSKVVGDKDMSAEFSVEVEFNEDDSKGNKGNSRWDKGWGFLPRDSEKDVVSTVALGFL